MATSKRHAMPVRDNAANTGYRWRDRDPILDLVNSLIEESNMSRLQIAVKCGVSISTLRNWDIGKTKRPQAVTVKFVLEAMGYSLAVQRNRDRSTILVPMNPRTGRPVAPRFT